MSMTPSRGAVLLHPIIASGAGAGIDAAGLLGTAL